MKLLLCTECWDVFKLARITERKCTCGKVTGAYLEDGLNAWYKGDTAMPLGFNNFSLIATMRHQPEEGWGEKFEAFIIPRQCSTFKKRD